MPYSDPIPLAQFVKQYHPKVVQHDIPWRIATFWSEARLFDDIWEKIKQTIQEFIRKPIEAVKKAAEHAVKQIQGLLGEIFDPVVRKIEEIITKIKSALPNFNVDFNVIVDFFKSIFKYLNFKLPSLPSLPNVLSKLRALKSKISSALETIGNKLLKYWQVAKLIRSEIVVATDLSMGNLHGVSAAADAAKTIWSIFKELLITALKYIVDAFTGMGELVAVARKVVEFFAKFFDQQSARALVLAARLAVNTGDLRAFVPAFATAVAADSRLAKITLASPSCGMDYYFFKPENKGAVNPSDIKKADTHKYEVVKGVRRRIAAWPEADRIDIQLKVDTKAWNNYFEAIDRREERENEKGGLWKRAKSAAIGRVRGGGPASFGAPSG